MHVLMMVMTVALAGTLGWLAVRMWRDVAPIVSRVLAREETVLVTVPSRRIMGRPIADPVRSRRTNLPVPVAA